MIARQNNPAGDLYRAIGVSGEKGAECLRQADDLSIADQAIEGRFVTPHNGADFGGFKREHANSVDAARRDSCVDQEHENASYQVSCNCRTNAMLRAIYTEA